MEVKQGEMTQQQWDEMTRITRENVCSECGAELTIYTIPERKTLRAGCVVNKEHRGLIEKETYTQGYRRGKEVHPAIRDRIERKALLPGGYDLGTALAMVQTRFPRAELDDPSAALFITDCVRLDLDPFLGEIVPATFYDSKTKRRIVQPIITEDGYLSMSARACPEEWNGPPKTMRLEDYLMTLEEHKGKPYDDIKEIAKDIKKSLVKDENAEVYYAIGRRKGQAEDTFSPGWFKSSESTKETREGKEYETIGGQAPGNQARVRAIKRFAREVYPESKAKMREMTAEWLNRAEGFDDVKNIIEAEYHIVAEEPSKGNEKADQQGGQKEGARTPKPRAQARKAETVPATQETSPDETIEGEGFSIPLEWLTESQKALKWSDQTMLSFLASSPYNVSGKSVTEALGKLTREKAEQFTREIDSKVENKQPKLI